MFAIPRRRLIISALVLASASLACATVLNTPAPKAGPNAAWQVYVDDLAALQSAQDFPDHFQQDENPARTGDEFDPNEYFTVLPNVSMEPGYVLDFVYHFDGLGGFPRLYARPTAQPRYATEADFHAAGGVDDAYLDHVQTDGTPEGYFQLALLHVSGAQFYLWWHAAYNDTQVIADPARLEGLIANTEEFCGDMPRADRRAALGLPAEPSVEPWQDDVTVRFLAFSKWGGFERRSIVFAKAFPHFVLHADSEVKVAFQCPVVF